MSPTNEVLKSWTDLFGVCCVSASLICSAWTTIYPKPYGLCLELLICMPLLAFLVALLDRDFRFPSFFAAFVSMIALFARVIDEIEETQSGSNVEWHGFLAILVLTLVWFYLADRGQLWKEGWAAGVVLSLLFFVPMAAMYAMATVESVNMLRDGATKHFSAPITKRDYELHLFERRHSSRYEITIAPLGRRDLPSWYSLSMSTYIMLHGESTACIDAGPGALGTHWYRVHTC